MAEITTQSSNNPDIPTLSNGEVFSVNTHDSAMQVISVAEARREFSHAGMTSQGAMAYLKNMLGIIGIELGGSQVEHAAHLVALRARAATNDSNNQSEDKKAA